MSITLANQPEISFSGYSRPCRTTWGDIIQFGGLHAGALELRTIPAKEVWGERYEVVAGLEYANLEILASHIEPEELAQIWPTIQVARDPRRINVEVI